MSRQFTTFLLMLCMCWQSLAYAGVGVLVAQGNEAAHAVLHFEATPHHHDEHGEAFHQDKSPDSTQHCMGDACSYAPFLLADLVLPLPSLRPDAPRESLSSATVLPFLRALDRPPKLNA